jgi:hypothetical protein
MTTQIVPIQVPMTNGVIRSFGHVRLSIAGLEFTGGFKSIDYSRKREREMVMSNSPDPVSKTLGENKYKCEAEVYHDWLVNLIVTIQNQIGPGYGDMPFPIYVSYVGANLTTYTDTILNCTIDETDFTNKSGNAALTRKIDFAPTKILINGLDDLAEPLQSPPQ